MRALALNCTLKPAPSESSCELLLGRVLLELRTHGVEGELLRVVDHDVKPGVLSDEGEGDAWPAIREKILAADILVLGTPIWLGQPSSVCKRVLERLDAFLSEQDEHGRLISEDRVAIVGVVGNEDGAHHVFAELAQALADVGFTIPSQGSTYWVGEAMQPTDYKDKIPPPDTTATTTATAARHGAHLARLLRSDGYPAPPG